MIWIGTSGFQYPEWKGNFYPARTPPAKMLTFYGRHFPTTEINYTFRRLPSDKTLANWLAQTPEQFRFTLKAPEAITHHQRLQNCTGLVNQFADAAMKLGTKRGALLFQLPPHFRCDQPALERLLVLLPQPLAIVFEFRHTSWFTDSVFATLRRHNAGWCIADTEKLSTPQVFTSSIGYLRLRRTHYSPADLRRWAELIQMHGKHLTDIYVYLKHEEAGAGPRLASRLMAILGLRKPEAETREQELPFGQLALRFREN